MPTDQKRMLVPSFCRRRRRCCIVCLFLYWKSCPFVVVLAAIVSFVLLFVDEWFAADALQSTIVVLGAVVNCGVDVAETSSARCWEPS